MQIVTFTTSGLTFVLIGALVMLGMRAVEYIIPRPESQILICYESDKELGVECKKLRELIEKYNQLLEE